MECQEKMKSTGESLKTPVWKCKICRKEDRGYCIFLCLDQHLPDS